MEFATFVWSVRLVRKPEGSNTRHAEWCVCKQVHGAASGRFGDRKCSSSEPPSLADTSLHNKKFVKSLDICCLRNHKRLVFAKCGIREFRSVCLPCEEGSNREECGVVSKCTEPQAERSEAERTVLLNHTPLANTLFHSQKFTHPSTQTRRPSGFVPAFACFQSVSR